ncbi:putative purple acid phosphatase precursor [Nostoc sp. NIES-3756]|uniref:metallophosphoesterase family protein n=1 Tax=Nostoc sp. NIES-3756 TaxID=1751286 RepID=UPI0007221079|nr:metallophosphoesterase [Nostoc sp. NIES-3756]BAT54663.1 putative purple acid phosphatase precursor [Nostoc sp. NIES-3756]BAY37558.1 putative purple acid phosphatase precursor [Nostoc sp. NIES-2111]
MNLNRRQFLFLSSFSAFGAGLLTWKFIHQHDSSTDVAIAAPPKKDLLLRFVSVADTGTGAKGQYAVARAMTNYHRQNPYDLVVLAGDNIYNNGEIEKINAVFERPYQDLLKQKVKFQACLGNHDIRTDNGDPQVRYPGFNMNGKRYYTFRRQGIQFFALDTNNNADWQNQLPWLEKELSSSNASWKVVFGHHPIYSSGVYGTNQAFVKTFTPLFKKYGVQLYINGHEHSYERTRPIDGTTYLICGAGAGNRPVGRSQWTEYSTSDLSFATYEVYPDRIEVSAIATNNRIFDKGIIKRS